MSNPILEGLHEIAQGEFVCLDYLSGQDIKRYIYSAKYFWHSISHVGGTFLDI